MPALVERAGDTRTALASMVCPIRWWAHQDSNLGQTGYEPAALPLSYGPRRDGATASRRRDDTTVRRSGR